jgi:hypothetical protein
VNGFAQNERAIVPGFSAVAGNPLPLMDKYCDFRFTARR